MVYHPVMLGPTEGQMSDLASGEEIKLSSKHLAGDVTLHLTTAQLKKLSKAKESGRGCTLKLSRTQLKHMAQHGSGRFSDMLSAGYNFLKPSLAVGLDKGLDFASSKAKDFARDKIGSLAGLGVQQGKGWLGDIGKALGHGGVDLAAKLLGGSVKAPRRKKQAGGALTADDFLRKTVMPAEALERYGRQQQGKGWLGDIGKSLGHGAVDFLADKLGGTVQVAPEPLSNPNEKIRSGLFQKKGKGSGLFMGKGLSL